MRLNRVMTLLALFAVLLTPYNSVAQKAVLSSDSSAALRTSITSQVRQAERNIISLFNANNGDNLFDIRCRNYRVTGSHIPDRVCAPSFMRRSSRQYRDLMGSNYNILRDPVHWTQYNDEEMRRFWMEFTDLVFKNEEFTAAVLHYGDLLEQMQVSTAKLATSH